MSGSLTPWALGMSPAISCPDCRRLPPGRVGPAVDPTMENGSDIGDISQGLAGDELWQGRFNVETACFSVAQSCEQRTPGRAGCHGGQVVIGESRAHEEGIPALGLRLGGQGQVLSGEPLHALCLVLLATDHVVGGHLGTFIASTPTRTPLAVIGSNASSWEV
jgi:hypothetical protein